MWGLAALELKRSRQSTATRRSAARQAQQASPQPTAARSTPAQRRRTVGWRTDLEAACQEGKGAPAAAETCSPPPAFATRFLIVHLLRWFTAFRFGRHPLSGVAVLSGCEAAFCRSTTGISGCGSSNGKVVGPPERTPTPRAPGYTASRCSLLGRDSFAPPRSCRKSIPRRSRKPPHVGRCLAAFAGRIQRGPHKAWRHRRRLDDHACCLPARPSDTPHVSRVSPVGPPTPSAAVDGHACCLPARPSDTPDVSRVSPVGPPTPLTPEFGSIEPNSAM